MFKKLINTYLAPPLAYIFIYLISLTVRVVEKKGNETEKNLNYWDGPIILSSWHDRLFFLPYYFRYMRKKCKVLASSSSDGAIVAGTVRLFGYGVLRGSSYKNATRALLSLKKSVARGFNVGLVGDGSRGPRYQLQPGAIIVSKLTQAPILPVVVSFERFSKLSTWDQFIIPTPFTRAVVIYGKPLVCPKSATEDEMEEYRKKLEESLATITAEADGYFTVTDA